MSPKSKYLISAALIVLVLFALSLVLPKLFAWMLVKEPESAGITFLEEYQPPPAISFNHGAHVQLPGLDCQYCHDAGETTVKEEGDLSNSSTSKPLKSWEDAPFYARLDSINAHLKQVGGMKGAVEQAVCKSCHY